MVNPAKLLGATRGAWDDTQSFSAAAFQGWLLCLAYEVQ